MDSEENSINEDNDTKLETKENETNNNEEESCTQEIIELGSDGSDIEILQVSSSIAVTRRKNIFKRLKQKFHRTKVRVKSVNCDAKNQESYIKEEIIISDASGCSGDEAENEAARSNNNLRKPNNLLRKRVRNPDDSLSSIILNCPKCNETETVFSTTITSECKKCQINMWYVCGKCNGRYGSMPALYRHKRLQCKFVIKLPKGQKMAPRKLFLRKCPKCCNAQKVLCSQKKTKCPTCKVGMFFECIICSKVYNSYSGVYRHVKLKCQPSHKTYYCNDCNYNCINPSLMMRHLVKSHTEMYAPEPSCIRCGKSFPNEASLSIHKATCNSLYLQCELCTYKPKYQSTLRKHMIKYHNDDVQKDAVEGLILDVVRRKERSKDYDYVRAYQNLQNNEHLQDLKSMYCPTCDKSQNFHSVQEDCKVCGTALLSKCVSCQKTFKNPPSLYRHVHRKHGSSNYKCNHCGRAFSFLGDLNEHRKTCGCEPHFECKFCLFKTRYKYNLQLHMAKLHNKNRRLYDCANCGVTYKTTKSIRKHMQFCRFLDEEMTLSTYSSGIDRNKS